MDPKTISILLKELELDIATRFVLSGLSANKAKIKEAFQLALEETAIRKKTKSAKQIKSTKATEEEVKKLVDSIAQSFKSQGFDVKVEHKMPKKRKAKKNKDDGGENE